MASLERSRAAAWSSQLAFTYVPMPPSQSRSARASRMARISSFGVSVFFGRSSSFCTSSDTVIDFALRSKTAPPFDSSAGL